MIIVALCRCTESCIGVGYVGGVGGAVVVVVFCIQIIKNALCLNVFFFFFVLFQFVYCFVMLYARCELMLMHAAFGIDSKHIYTNVDSNNSTPKH